MLIQDLNYLEITSNEVEGGNAAANALALSLAIGADDANASTATATFSNDGPVVDIAFAGSASSGSAS